VRRWLVVGLGNPGPEYEWSPHNAGFHALDRFAERHGIRIHRPECQALVGLSESAIAAKPQSFMNLSGGPVKQLLAKYELTPSQLLLVYDELAFEWGELRIKPKGSAGGHNGIASVIRSLGTDEFPRLRIGVSPGHPLASGKDYLLTPVRRGQKEEMDRIVTRAAEAIESIMNHGVEKSMAVFNRRAGGESKEEA
jgi:PTH1 family peptidyl-tRNA hydrolase